MSEKRKSQRETREDLSDRQNGRVSGGDQPVGYCSPPREHQWRAGHCPNPKGRPRKRENIVKKPSMPNEFERRLIEDAKKVIGEINGQPVDNIDKIWLTLKTNVKDPGVAKLVLQQYEAAIAVDHAWRECAVADLLAYKAHWGPIFEIRRKTKRSLPDQYPDPDDIVISSPTDFRFLGPVTEQEARDWEFFREAREAFFMVAQEIIDWSGDVFSNEEGYERWAKVRRKFYRINRCLPVAFKKKYPAKFPPFEPSCVLMRGDGGISH
jgi:hypothetical protein